MQMTNLPGKSGAISTTIGLSPPAVMPYKTIATIKRVITASWLWPQNGTKAKQIAGPKRATNSNKTLVVVR